MTEALLLSLLAGLAIVVGGFVAALEHIRPQWLEQEFRHSVIAFGGGALLAAVALVMVPDGARNLSAAGASAAFLVGAGFFLLADWMMARRGGSAAQLMAMLLDFVPEAAALGAAFALASPAGPLLAFLIGLQNLPEGFNAYREMTARGSMTRGRVLASFALLSLLGPAAAWVGIVALSDRPATLARLMMFCGGGILYLTFQDIAPQAKLERHWGPALGAVAGFLLGLVGQMLLVGRSGV
jgi:ZIP family zinc transporter